MIKRLYIFALAVAVSLIADVCLSHDIHGPKGQLCCNGSSDGQTGDCAPTLAKAEANDVAYLVGGKTWVRVPNDHVTFLPVPGEETQVLPPAGEGLVWGHFCGVVPNAAQASYRSKDIFDGVLVYCAFYPPGSI